MIVLLIALIIISLGAVVSSIYLGVQQVLDEIMFYRYDPNEELKTYFSLDMADWPLIASSTFIRLFIALLGILYAFIGILGVTAIV